MAATPGAGSRFGLVDALNAEWAVLADDPAPAGYNGAQVCRWSTVQDGLAGCTTPAQVLTAVRAAADPALAALIAVHQRGHRESGARTGPGLAGRIVVQAMLGKLVTMARRDRRCGVEDYVGRLWERIADYPLGRRPQRVAANLALDTLKAVSRDRWAADRAAHLVAAAVDLDRAALGRADVAPGGATADLTARRVLRRAQDLGLIDAATRRLLWSVYAEGLTSAAAADRHGLTPTTVRYRCSRAIRILARHSDRLSDAA